MCGSFAAYDAYAAGSTLKIRRCVGVVRVGRAAVRKFYADQFLSQIPPDLETTPLSQTAGDNRLVEEMVVRFTHSTEMDWLLPGLQPTGRRAEFVVAGVIEFEGGKIAHEHLSIGIGPLCSPRWASSITRWQR